LALIGIFGGLQAFRLIGLFGAGDYTPDSLARMADQWKA
jgi:hypothetical protein